MGFEFKLSLDTLFVSGVIAVVGWILQEAIKALIKTLIATIAKVEVLNSKIETLIDDTKAIPKMKQDLNALHSRVDSSEEEIQALKEARDDT